MKRFLAFFLVVLMLMPTCFASFVATSDTFPEAGTCYVEEDFDVVVSGKMVEDWDSKSNLQDKKFIFEQTTIPTEEQVKASMQRLGLGDNTRTTWVYLQNYIVYNQIAESYCGPACLQAALRYINQTAPESQSLIASQCGTDSVGTTIDAMIRYINAHQSRRRYVKVTNLGEGTMQSCLYYGVAQYNAPPIIGLAFGSSDGWFYNTGLHAMSVYGARDDWGRFALADPWIGYPESGLAESGIGWSYAVSSDLLADAYYEAAYGLMY